MDGWTDGWTDGWMWKITSLDDVSAGRVDSHPLIIQSHFTVTFSFPFVSFIVITIINIYCYFNELLRRVKMNPFVA